jgi:hypothetical protein
MYKFPDLYARDTKGKIKVWQLEVEGAVFTSYAGKLHGNLTPAPTYAAGKNFGKANETSNEEQAMKEAKAKWKKQHDKGYRISIELADAAPKRPNLCQDYKDMGHNMVFPCLLGPKLNGMRVYSVKNPETGEYEGFSRYLKDVRIPGHVQNVLGMESLPDVIDGELYIHGWHLQDILSLIKRPFEYENGKSGKLSTALRPDYQLLEYHIFDFPHMTQLAGTRIDMFRDANSMNKTCAPIVQFVPAREVFDEAEALEYRTAYEKRGFEGIVMRAIEGTYDYGSKTRNMMKWKSFQDAEYKCIGIELDKNGLAIARLVTKEGIEFNASIEGKNGYPTNTDYKRAIVDCPSMIVGHNCTVRFQEYTKDLVPSFGIMQAIRNYE